VWWLSVVCVCVFLLVFTPTYQQSYVNE